MKNPSGTLENRVASASVSAPASNKTFGFDAVKIQNLTLLGKGVSRYGLVILLLIFGAYKFFNFEAQLIHPLVTNSPLMSWLYHLFGVRETSALIGLAEITLAILIALRPWFPKVSALGSLGGALMFITTLSFLITTPGMWTVVEGVPVTTDGGFIFKDLILLGVSLWTAGEVLLAAHINSGKQS
jgi:uncharacterized membrane protein YkgB